MSTEPFPFHDGANDRFPDSLKDFLPENTNFLSSIKMKIDQKLTMTTTDAESKETITNDFELSHEQKQDISKLFGDDDVESITIKIRAMQPSMVIASYLRIDHFDKLCEIMSRVEPDADDDIPTWSAENEDADSKYYSEKRKALEDAKSVPDCAHETPTPVFDPDDYQKE